MSVPPQQSYAVPTSYPVQPINPAYLQTTTSYDPDVIDPKPKKSKKDKRRKREEDEGGKLVLCCGLTLRSWVLLIMWILATGGFIAYFVIIFLNLQLSLSDPTTSIILEPSEDGTRAFPAVTICNWNTEGPPPNQGSNCPYCRLSFVECYQADDNCGSDLLNRIAPKVLTSPEGAIFYCYQFNYDYRDTYYADEPGYDGSVSLVFDIDKPYANASSVRLGVQVTFHSQNITEPFVWNETNYVRAWTEGSYRITEVRSIPLEENETVYYEAKASAIGLAGVDVSTLQPNKARIIVSFSYETLSQKVVREIYTYNVSSFLGDLAGMAGLLMGLDSLKLVRGFLALTKCRQKGLAPFARVFNN